MRGRRKRRRSDGYKAGSYDPDLLLGCRLALHRERAFREAEGRQKHPSYHEVAARSRGLTGEQSWKNCNKEGSGKRIEALKRKNFPRRSKSPLSPGLFLNPVLWNPLRSRQANDCHLCPWNVTSLIYTEDKIESA